jgi:hypothetical protein
MKTKNKRKSNTLPAKREVEVGKAQSQASLGKSQEPLCAK